VKLIVESERLYGRVIEIHAVTGQCGVTISGANRIQPE